MAAQPIEVDSKTAHALAEYASALGMSVPDFLAKHFANGNGVEKITDVDRWLDELAEGVDAPGGLPRDFSTRDVYADHD